MAAEAREVPVDSGEGSSALARLEADGLVARDEGGYKTSRGWRRAMARAAVKLYEAGDPGDDLRVPIAVALLERYQDTVGDEALAELIEAILPIEAASLGLTASRARSVSSGGTP